MDTVTLINMTAKGDRQALDELYATYGAAFYAVALSMTKDKEAAESASSEAFHAVRDLAPAFEKEMNAEYWIYEILYKTCAKENTKRSDAGKAHDLISGMPAEAVIKAFTKLSISDIAAITGKRRSAVSGIIKSRSADIPSVVKYAEAVCPDYKEKALSEAPREKKDGEPGTDNKKNAKNANGYKRLLTVIVLTAFISVAVFMIVRLANGTYSGDVDKNALGEEVLLQFNNKTAMTEINGALYYRGKDKAFYRTDMNTNETVRISDDYPMEMINDGEYIYYRNYNDGKMYRMDPDTLESTLLCDAPGTTLALYGGYVYFSSYDGIYRLPSSGGDMSSAELMLDTSSDSNLYCVDMAIDESGNVFFAGGVGKGVHHITEYKGEPSVDGVFIEEVYNVQTDAGNLYFDYKEMSGRIVLYRLELDGYYDFLENKELKRVWPSIATDKEGNETELATGAFYAEGGNVYYAGESDGISALYMLDSSGENKKLTDIMGNEKNIYITDIYAAGGHVYCYCSDGKSGGKSMLFAYDLSTSDVTGIYQ